MRSPARYFHLFIICLIPFLIPLCNSLAPQRTLFAENGSSLADTESGITVSQDVSTVASNSQAPPPVHVTDKSLAGTQKVKVGFFMLSGGKLDFVTSSLALDFYLWLTFTGSSTPQFEFLNSKNVVVNKLEEQLPMPDSDKNYVVYRINGTFDQNFDLKNYPFDRFVIRIFLEDTEQEAHERAYVADTVESGFDPMFHIMGWNIQNLSISAKEHRYQTTFGEPNKTAKETYSQIELTIKIFRNHRIIFLKMVTPAILFLLIGVMGVILPIDQLSQKISLCVASLFSSVAYHLSLSQGLPPISYLTFVDKMMISNYGIIFINLILTIGIYLSGRNEYHRLQYSLTWVSWIALPTLAFGIIYWLILHGLYS